MNRFGHHLLSALASACLLALSGCSGATDSGGPSSDAGKPAEEHPFDPTSPRTAQVSKSLTLAPDWKPPAPTRTRPAPAKSRVQPAKHYGVPTRSVGLHPSDAEIGAVPRFMEPLRPVPGASSAEETNALALALREEQHDDRGVEALQRFTEA